MNYGTGGDCMMDQATTVKAKQPSMLCCREGASHQSNSKMIRVFWYRLCKTHVSMFTDMQHMHLHLSSYINRYVYT